MFFLGCNKAALSFRRQRASLLLLLSSVKSLPFVNVSVYIYIYIYILYIYIVDVFSERQILKKNRRRCSLVRRGRSAAWGRTVRDLAQGLGFPA
jgi:hypothetical protein